MSLIHRPQKRDSGADLSASGAHTVGVEYFASGDNPRATDHGGYFQPPGAQHIDYQAHSRSHALPPVRPGSANPIEIPQGDEGAGHTAYPMQSLNGLVIAKPDRRNPTSDFDLTPRQFRRFMGASGAQEVQINNGMRNRTLTGLIMNYPGENYLNVVQPHMPGYRKTGQNAGGFHKRGPDPLSIFQLYQDGPGSQPSNPGGPGKIVGRSFTNPMTG
jgi:hypothetical protein